MRNLHKKLRGSGWCVQTGSFMKKICKSKFVLNEVPWGYIEDLKSHVFERIDLIDE